MGGFCAGSEGYVPGKIFHSQCVFDACWQVSHSNSQQFESTFQDKERTKQKVKEKVEELKRENYVLLSSEVDYIISNDIADLNRIEHVLDMLIDCIYDEESRNIEIEDALRNSGSVKGREVKVPKVVDEDV